MGPTTQQKIVIIWNVRSPYRPGSFKTSTELANCKLDFVEVGGGPDGTVL